MSHSQPEGAGQRATQSHLSQCHLIVKGDEAPEVFRIRVGARDGSDTSQVLLFSSLSTLHASFSQVSRCNPIGDFLASCESPVNF